MVWWEQRVEAAERAALVAAGETCSEAIRQHGSGSHWHSKREVVSAQVKKRSRGAV